METEVQTIPRERVSLTLLQECLTRIDKIASRVYTNRSHTLEVLILEAMKKEKE